MRVVRIFGSIGLVMAVPGLAWAQFGYPYYYPPPTYYPPVYRPAYPPPPVYAPSYPPAYVPPPPVRPSEAVAEAQRWLSQLGYDPGPDDGLIGPRVIEAVRNFQRDRDQPVTGRLTGETVGALREAARSREIAAPSAATDRPGQPEFSLPDRGDEPLRRRK